MKIYLAGGFHSGWQDRVIAACPQHQFFDPRVTRGLDPPRYTFVDIMCICLSDVVLAYMEVSNPSGIGLAFEVGYAMGLQKPVILICEKEDRYFMIVKEAVTVEVPTLKDAIEVLNRVQPVEGS